ncbi:MAG: NYN domain-containing protein [Bacteroidia bacterium]|nr:NYN domain-containing protein [Bacteroidia bacterium]
MEGYNVAIYLDFENLALSAEAVYPSRERPLLIEPLVDYVTTKGEICVKKAYADWSKDIFNQYQHKLMEQGFELVHLPSTTNQGKNGADVRLAVDVMDYMEQFPEIKTVVIGSGDTDFIPLIQRLRSRGKHVLIIGFEHSVGHLVKRNCTEFKALNELIGKPEAGSLSADLTDEPDATAGRELMLRYIRTRDDDAPILLSSLKQQLLRLDPSFSEKELGFSSFKHFIASLLGDVVERIEMVDSTLPVVHLAEAAQADPAEHVRPSEHAGQFLIKKLRYQNDTRKRLLMAAALIEGLKGREALSMNQMQEFVSDQIRQKLPKLDIKKYINTLFSGGAFIQHEKKTYGPLLSRPLRLDETIQHPEVLDQVYIRRVSEILQSRYNDLSAQEILELLF